LLRNWKYSPKLAMSTLVIVTAVWGYTFVTVKEAISYMPVMDFLAVRFSLAAVVMLILRPTCLRHITRRGLWRGMVLGVMLGLSFITQTYGLVTASATVSGFITGMNVVITPILAWIFLRQHVSLYNWLAVALTTIGLALLSLYGWSFGTGEMLTLLCAMFIAIHIVALGAWSSKHEIYSLALVQVATVAVICSLAAIPGGITIPPNVSVWETIGITAVLATALAFFVQTWAQSLISPTKIAIIMTMEPVFAGIFGVIIGGDKLTLRIISGAACVLVAMFITNLKSKPSEENLNIME